MKAANIINPNQLQIVEMPTPEPGPDEVLIKVMASGICGTDVHIYRGEYLGGYPVIPGHEFAGVVEAVGDGVERFKAGDRVAVEPNIACDNCEDCLNNRQNFCQNWTAVGVTRPGGMAQYVTAPEKAAFSIGSLPFEVGAFMEPLSCVVHGVERLDPAMGARTAIVGAGPIGILLLQVLQAQGAGEMTVVDKNTGRTAYAKAMGADVTLTSLDALEKDGYEVVVDATGAPTVMERCINFARPGGKVLLFGVPPAGEKLAMEGFAIFRKGLTVLSSYTSVRNSYQALELLHRGRVLLEGLVSHRLPLQGLVDGIEMLAAGVEGVRKVMVLPNR
jgi:2-desacetyl-2-hydroxyethyl bacteriochlorophyllide A dehydrogenase